MTSKSIKANLVLDKILRGKHTLLIKKNSPAILSALGVTGVVGCVVMSCKATIKARSILEEHERDRNMIHKCANMIKDGSYTEHDKCQDLTTLYTQTAIKLVKLYAPAVLLGVGSIACLLGAQNILSRRNVAITAAYNAVAGHFADYRARVVDKYGEDEDRLLYHGLKEGKNVPLLEENGEISEKEALLAKANIIDPNDISQYARIFDDSSRYWQPSPGCNFMFLKARQSYMNNLLHSRGYVFLNEVYKELGLPKTKEGCVVGWVLSDKGDNFIDFGIFNTLRPEVRDFVNGYEPSILLDFNVDGVIYDLIEQYE